MLETEQFEKTLDYPLDSRVSVVKGMTLCTDDGKFKIVQYRGSEVYHQDVMGKEQKGYAPKVQPGANEWRRYTLLVEKG